MPTTHSPGPWTRNEFGKLLDANGEQVHFLSVSSPQSGERESIDSAEANTHLAETCSDLLELLREWHDIEYAHWCDETVEYEIQMGNGMAPLVKRIRAAITKATPPAT